MTQLLRGTSVSYATDADRVEIDEARLTPCEGLVTSHVSLHLSYEEKGERKSLTATSSDGSNFVGAWASPRRGLNASPEGEVKLKLARGSAGLIVLYGSWHEFGSGDVGGWIIELHES